MTSFGPISDLFKAENVTSKFGESKRHFEEAGDSDKACLFYPHLSSQPMPTMSQAVQQEETTDHKISDTHILNSVPSYVFLSQTYASLVVIFSSPVEQLFWCRFFLI